MMIMVDSGPPPRPPTSSENGAREQAEFGERLPLLAAETLLARDDLAARVEIILVAQQALDAGSQ